MSDMPKFLFIPFGALIVLFCFAFMQRGVYICDKSESQLIPAHEEGCCGGGHPELHHWVEEHWENVCVKSHTEWHDSFMKKVIDWFHG